MRYILMTSAIVTALAFPLAAQQAEAEQEGFSLMEEGAKLLLRGLMEEIEPNMEEFQDLMEEFGPSIQGFMIELGPRLEELLDLVDDIEYYGEAEILPNGDIIIRRDPTAPPFNPPTAEGEIEL